MSRTTLGVDDSTRRLLKTTMPPVTSDRAIRLLVEVWNRLPNDERRRMLLDAACEREAIGAGTNDE